MRRNVKLVFGLIVISFIPLVYLPYTKYTAKTAQGTAAAREIAVKEESVAEEQPIEPVVVKSTVIDPYDKSRTDWAYDWENDPIGSAFYQKVPPLINNVLARYRQKRKYSTTDFPLSRERHHEFKNAVKKAMIASLTGDEGDGLDWVIGEEQIADKGNKVIERISINRIDTILVEGCVLELSIITIKDTGDKVPMVIAFPEKTPAPAIAVFSGHTHYGLREIFIDRSSYQRGIGLELCKAGYVVGSIEKIDSGILSRLFQDRGEHWREGVWADDEDVIATTLAGVGDYIIPARQLMANISLVEVMAGDPRVESDRLGSAGVSLGGWLALQTCLVNSRIKAVANFGGMWSFLEEHDASKNLRDFEGINDYSQLFPGIWQLGDQNRFVFAAAPIPMLTGYGSNSVPYVSYKRFFHPTLEEQYRSLGKPENLELFIHDGGHLMPVDPVIEFFNRRL